MRLRVFLPDVWWNDSLQVAEAKRLEAEAAERKRQEEEALRQAEMEMEGEGLGEAPEIKVEEKDDGKSPESTVVAAPDPNAGLPWTRRLWNKVSASEIERD